MSRPDYHTTMEAADRCIIVTVDIHLMEGDNCVVLADSEYREPQRPTHMVLTVQLAAALLSAAHTGDDRIIGRGGLSRRTDWGQHQNGLSLLSSAAA
jgi:hypothetical protein